MQWTDRIRQVKIILVVAAIAIAVVSLVASNILTKDLARQERTKMEVWAEAMRALSQADENTDLALVLKVLNDNNTIPVVVLDNDENVTDFRNVVINAKNYKDSLLYVSDMAKRLKKQQAKHKNTTFRRFKRIYRRVLRRFADAETTGTLSHVRWVW